MMRSPENDNHSPADTSARRRGALRDLACLVRRRFGTIAASPGLNGIGRGIAASTLARLTANSEATYDAARKVFEAGWQRYLPTRTPADFHEWRHHVAWTAEKYARWDRGEREPPPM